jgi:predicted DNA-binding helix-hairpin-helix protein
VKAVDRLLLTRRVRRLRSDDLQRLHVPVNKVLPFVVLVDHRPARVLDVQGLVAQATQAVPRQVPLF